jgi:hypothetical protein
MSALKESSRCAAAWAVAQRPPSWSSQSHIPEFTLLIFLQRAALLTDAAMTVTQAATAPLKSLYSQVTCKEGPRNLFSLRSLF